VVAGKLRRQTNTPIHNMSNNDLPDQGGSLDNRGNYVPFYPNPEENMNLWERVWRYPWVTIGAFSTAGILGAGLWTLKTGNSALGQKLMRARVAAQFTTVVLLLGASGVLTLKSITGEESKPKISSAASASSQNETH
jgi:hypothetical protein